MIGRLFKFHGGIKPDAHKNESAGVAIRKAPLPPRLVVPLRQSARAGASCIVAVGQKVLKGERIGEPEGFLGTAVHAPTSGTVTAIDSCPMAHPSGLDTPCVVIEPDGEERWIEHATPFDHHTATREQALAWLRDCGIVVAEPEGRQTRYEIADPHLAAALTALVDVTLAVDEHAPCVDSSCTVPGCCGTGAGE